MFRVLCNHSLSFIADDLRAGFAALWDPSHLYPPPSILVAVLMSCSCRERFCVGFRCPSVALRWIDPRALLLFRRFNLKGGDDGEIPAVAPGLHLSGRQQGNRVRARAAPGNAPSSTVILRVILEVILRHQRV